MEIAWSVVSKLIIGLISLMIVVRVLGRKSLAQMTPYDFVYTLVLGGILEESLYDDQVTIWHLILGIGLWGLLIFSLEFISSKNERLNKIFKGEPSVIVYDGKIVKSSLQRNKLEMEQLRSLLRVQNCFSLKNAQHLIMETGGQVSLTTYDSEDQTLTFLLVDEGKIETKVMENLHFEEKWLKDELAALGYHSISDIIYAEWSEENGFYVVAYDDMLTDRVRLDG